MKIMRISPENAAGLLDKIIGLGKEIIGHVIDRRTMIEAGVAQQQKGNEKLEALREEAKADAHGAKARVYEEKQRTAQRAASN